MAAACPVFSLAVFRFAAFSLVVLALTSCASFTATAGAHRAASPIIVYPARADPGRVTGRPIAVIGASFAAGVGARGRQYAWPARLGRILHRRVVVVADPGAGYLATGEGHRGPFRRLARHAGLVRLDPGLVIIQGGHDDIGHSPVAEGRAVSELIGSLHRQLPRTRIGVITVFTRGNRPSPAARRINRAIVIAARKADDRVTVMSPIAEHWAFPRISDRLHPTRAGHAWIARRVAADLRTGS